MKDDPRNLFEAKRYNTVLDTSKISSSTKDEERILTDVDVEILEQPRQYLKLPEPFF